MLANGAVYFEPIHYRIYRTFAETGKFDGFGTVPPVLPQSVSQLKLQMSAEPPPLPASLQENDTLPPTIRRVRN